MNVVTIKTILMRCYQWQYSRLYRVIPREMFIFTLSTLMRKVRGRFFVRWVALLRTPSLLPSLHGVRLLVMFLKIYLFPILWFLPPSPLALFSSSLIFVSSNPIFSLWMIDTHSSISKGSITLTTCSSRTAGIRPDGGVRRSILSITFLVLTKRWGLSSTEHWQFSSSHLHKT